jgi:hypothetical protein
MLAGDGAIAAVAGGPVPGGVRYSEPGALRVLGVGKLVPADLISWQDVARDRRSPDSGDPRRQEVLLDVGDGAGLAGVDVVDVCGHNR